MFLINDSLTVVFIGDWNKLYIQPDWIANNIFEKENFEIGVNGQGSDVTISYRSDGIIISPEQSRIIFSVTTINDDIINRLCGYLDNFIKKAHTPQSFLYGLNINFMENDGIGFAEVLDSMSDANAIIENGYEIISTNISRLLKCNDTIISMDSKLENSKLNVHFNQEHSSDEIEPNFSVEYIKDFLNKCYEILRGLGYEMECDE